jgi:hypothetical protein
MIHVVNPVGLDIIQAGSDAAARQQHPADGLGWPGRVVQASSLLAGDRRWPPQRVWRPLSGGGRENFNCHKRVSGNPLLVELQQQMCMCWLNRSRSRI